MTIVIWLAEDSVVPVFSIYRWNIKHFHTIIHYLFYILDIERSHTIAPNLVQVQWKIFHYVQHLTVKLLYCRRVYISPYAIVYTYVDTSFIWNLVEFAVNISSRFHTLWQLKKKSLCAPTLPLLRQGYLSFEILRRLLLIVKL